MALIKMGRCLHCGACCGPRCPHLIITINPDQTVTTQCKISGRDDVSDWLYCKNFPYSPEQLNVTCGYYFYDDEKKKDLKRWVREGFCSKCGLCCGYETDIPCEHLIGDKPTQCRIHPRCTFLVSRDHYPPNPQSLLKGCTYTFREMTETEWQDWKKQHGY